MALRIVIEPAEGSDTSPFEAEGEAASICYHVLGKVHGIWTPLPRTLKDYISSPKPNGYRSLHVSAGGFELSPCHASQCFAMLRNHC